MPGVRAGAGPATGTHYVRLTGERGMTPDGWHWGELVGRVPETVKIKGPLVPGQRVQFQRLWKDKRTQWGVLLDRKVSPHHAAAGAGPGVVAYDAYSYHPGARLIVPPAVPNPSVTAQAVGLSSSQKTMAQVIEREFEAAGFGPPVIVAAIINAIAESGLNPEAVGDGGASVGLFQLHEKGGGHGMSVSERKDPSLNTRRIIEQAKKAKGFMGLVNDGETSAGKLTAAFTVHVERPSNKVVQGAKRAAMVSLYFPTLVGSALIREAREVPWWIWAFGGLSVAVALWGAYGVIRHRR